jgi:hypothetical protein
MKNNQTVPGYEAARRHADQSVVSQAFRRGYYDALAGRGFDPEYESACETFQGNYENGRLLGRAILRAGVDAPKWPAGDFLPPAIQALYLRIGGNNQDCILPDGKMPDKPDLDFKINLSAHRRHRR